MMTVADLELQAQRSAETWLEDCYAGLDDEECMPEGGELFCGCTTCIVREVLTAAAPHLYSALVEYMRERGVVIPEDVATFDA